MGNERYRKLTHGTGFFRYFFNKLKEGATGNGPIKRMFITGVSPVTMDDVTSGFNIGANMSTDLFSLEMDRLGMLVASMAYEGNWKPVFEYFASELKRQSSIREFIEGEAHVKGFLLAYLGLARTYIIYPEYEANKGYADFYMMPDLLHRIKSLIDRMGERQALRFSPEVKAAIKHARVIW